MKYDGSLFLELILASLCFIWLLLLDKTDTNHEGHQTSSLVWKWTKISRYSILLQDWLVFEGKPRWTGLVNSFLQKHKHLNWEIIITRFLDAIASLDLGYELGWTDRRRKSPLVLQPFLVSKPNILLFSHHTCEYVHHFVLQTLINQPCAYCILVS